MAKSFRFVPLKLSDMGKVTLFLLFNLLFESTLFSQPNLVLSSGIITTTSIKRGDHLKIAFRVSNTGNVAASKSHVSIYVSKTLSYTTAVLLSEISCESLAAGQQTQDVNFIYPLPYNVTTGINNILIYVDSRNEVAESNESNSFPLGSTINVSSIYGSQQNLPYPIILMHGLNGNDTTWYPFLRDVQSYYGYSYGGNFDFCLNQDGNENDAYLQNDVKNWTDSTQLGAGDFYTINFNVDNNGNKYVASSKSNQSAAIKQGWAIQQVAKKVLLLTGKDKVILAGHSMGGLACREYLQNPYRWQSDGKHHVAKLFTNGTPHGGSNATLFGFGVSGIDEKSEAVRDLRRSYAISGDPGVYLFGGIESNSVMWNNILFDYHNVDVNCDGFIGEIITGLNQKNIYTNLLYSCVIGVDPSTILCSDCDGVVNTTCANLNNYYTSIADTFMCIRSGSSTSSPLHIELPKQTDFMLKGLDEANEYDLGYGIDTGGIYFANFSVQSKAGYIYDYDDYKLSVPCDGLLKCKLYNVPISQCYYQILDTSYNLLYRDSTNGKSYIEFNTNLIKGKYFIEFYCKPEEDTWYYPYAFKLNIQPILPIAGRIITPKNSIVKNVSVNMYKDSVANTLTDVNGKYSFTLSKIGNYTLRPTKNNDSTKNNGVSTFDIILTQRHLLGLTKLNSPYKIIAADVNGNNGVSNIDIILMKRLILGLDTTFTSIKGEKSLWAFVDSSYTFPDTTNPFPYKDSISFTNLSSNKINQSFIGVKLGDVDYSWNAGIPRSMNAKPVELTYSVDNGQWTMDNGKGNSNNELSIVNSQLSIPVTVSNFKQLLGLQYTLHFDNGQYEFVRIDNNKLGIDFNVAQANATGNISMLWVDKNVQAKTMEDESEMFTLVLHRKESGISNWDAINSRSTHDLKLTLSSDIAEVEAWDNNEQKHNIIITKLQTPNNELTNKPINVLTIYPNPSKGEVNIEVTNAKELLITDYLGRIVYRSMVNSQWSLVNANQSNNLKSSTLNIKLPKGVYFVKAIYKEGEKVKKLVVE